MRRLVTLATLAASPVMFAQDAPPQSRDDGVPMHHMADRFAAPVTCSITPPGEYGIRGNYQANTWPGGIIPYTFGEGVTEINQNNTRAALDEIEQIANIQFIERTDERDFITYVNSNRNSSPVGQVGGQQIINMVNWNIRTTIQHETYHSLGVWHEQQRPDRDQYVTVNFGNIEFALRFNFDIPAGATAFGDYDFESIMHYSACAFSECPNCQSNDPGCRAITVLPPNEEFQDTIGQRNQGLSQGDIELMQFLYGRPTIDNDDCSTPTLISLDQVIGASNQVALSFGSSACAPSGADAWYSYTPPFSDRFRINTCGSEIDTVISIHSGCPGDESTEITCNNDNFFVCGAGTSSSLTLAMTEGVEYLIRVAGVNEDLGDYNLTVNVAPPVNDECDGAPVIFGDGVYEFTNEFATTDGLADALCNGTSKQIEKDVWYSWTAATAGNVQMTLCGQTTIDSNVAVYRNINCPVGTETITCDDDGCGGLQSQVFWATETGETFLIRIGSYEGTPGGEGTFTITTGPPIDNNDCADALPVNGDGSYPFDNAVATTDGLPSPVCDVFGLTQIDNDVWYAWTAGATGAATIATCGGTVVDTKIAVYDSFDCGSSTPLACSEDACALQSSISIDVTTGEQYLIRIGTFPGAEVGNGTFTITTALATGACCNNGSCEITSERDCTAAGGAYLGDEIACDFAPAGTPELVNGNVTEAVIGPNPADDEITDTVALVDPPEQIGAVTVTVDLAHDFIEDVEIDLTHVATGTTIRLLEDICPEEQDLAISITFDDNGLANYNCFGTTPVLQPVQPFSTFTGLDGDSQWTLTVRDDFLDGEGTLFSWSISVDAIGESVCDRPTVVTVDRAPGVGDVTTIQAGIDLVAPAGEVIVNPGAYRELLDFRGKAVDLHSTDPADPDVVAATSISAQTVAGIPLAFGRVITATSGESANTSVRGFTIRDGDGRRADDNGSDGGGIYISNSGLTIEDCVFINNTGDNGGHIAIREVSSGAGSTVNIRRCTFNTNRTPPPTSVGGVYARQFSGNLNIDACLFDTNANGAVSIGTGTLTMQNSAIIGTIGTAPAIDAVDSANLIVTNTTVTANEGDGLNIARGANRVALIANTIVWGNTGDEIVTPPSFATPDITHSIIEGGYDGDGNLDADPLFVDAPAGDSNLSEGSPAIDAGDNNAASDLTLDLDGDPRFADDTGTPDTGVGPAPIVDIGADEFQGTTVPETCICEFEDDTEVSVLDLLNFLDAWFIDAPEADLNTDEVVDVLDLLTFLDCYFIAIGNDGICE